MKPYFHEQVLLQAGCFLAAFAMFISMQQGLSMSSDHADCWRG
jgi:hypothetical protein